LEGLLPTPNTVVIIRWSITDLSVRAGGLNTGRMCTGSGKIRIGCILVLRVYFGFMNFGSTQQVESAFSWVISFFVKKNSAYLYLKLFVSNEKAFKL